MQAYKQYILPIENIKYFIICLFKFESTKFRYQRKTYDSKNAYNKKTVKYKKILNAITQKHL